MRYAIYHVLFLTLLSGQYLRAQDSEIHLSGIVLMLDSLKPIPNTHVYVSGSRIGVRTDDVGLFSLKVHVKDTVVFSSIGSKTTFYIVPDSLSGKSYSIIQRMPQDTIALKTIEITSWPSIDQFNEAFTREFGFDQRYKAGQHNANPNMSNVRLDMRELDANDNFRLYGMRYANQFSYIYENAHIPLTNVLNPLNWNKLVKSWESGSNK